MGMSTWRTPKCQNFVAQLREGCTDTPADRDPKLCGPRLPRRRFHHVAPTLQRTELDLPGLEQVTNPLLVVGFEDEIGEVTLLRGLKSEPVDVSLDEPDPAGAETFRRQQPRDPFHLLLVGGGALGR